MFNIGLTIPGQYGDQGEPGPPGALGPAGLPGLWDFILKKTLHL